MNFQPVIFQQADETKPERTVWVRITPSVYGVDITLFQKQPTPETPMWQSMASISVDVCFGDRSKLVVWDENQDQVLNNGTEIVLIESVEDWKPLSQEKPNE